MALACCKKKKKNCWHYYHGDFYYLNCLHSFATNNKLEFYEKMYVEKKTFVELFCQLKKTLHQNLINIWNQIKCHIHINIYADIESLIKKVDNCEKNLEHSSTTRIGKHIPCAHSKSTILVFNHIEDEHTL